ncbi:hypothetical protein QQP08_008217 [Theobroma cacao]|nr:hypothetical protein QQP08_008217 [Theobroma cacao]
MLKEKATHKYDFSKNNLTRSCQSTDGKLGFIQTTQIVQCMPDLLLSDAAEISTSSHLFPEGEAACCPLLSPPPHAVERDRLHGMWSPPPDFLSLVITNYSQTEGLLKQKSPDCFGEI